MGRIYVRKESRYWPREQDAVATQEPLMSEKPVTLWDAVSGPIKAGTLSIASSTYQVRVVCELQVATFDPGQVRQVEPERYWPEPQVVATQTPLLRPKLVLLHTRSAESVYVTTRVAQSAYQVNDTVADEQVSAFVSVQGWQVLAV